MKTIERLEAYLKHKGISYNAFDNSIEAGNGYIGKQIRNKASIGSDTIEKIVSIYPDLSLEWLITGKGNMLKEARTPPEIELNLENSSAYERKARTSTKGFDHPNDHPTDHPTPKKRQKLRLERLTAVFLCL